MKAIKASILYDGKGRGIGSNQYIVFDKKIRAISSSKPSCELIGEGIVTPAFIDGHCHIGMARSGEPEKEEEANEEMETIIPLIDAIDSIYMDDKAFKESIEWGVLYSHVMPGSGNIIGGKTVLIRNFSQDIEDALVKHVGVKAALGYNPRSLPEWKGKRPTTRMGALALLREEFMKALKAKKLVKQRKKKNRRD
jgi:imidazolonepropionase-like amidohydrolase